MKIESSFIKKLEKVFGKEIGQHSCILFEDEFRYVLNKIKPRIFVDIGTFKGLSAGFVAKYYADIVYTFDIDRGAGLLGYGVSRECSQAELEIKYDIWDYLGVRDKIRDFTVERSIQYQGKKAILDTIEFDMALLDGDHKYQSIKEDFGLTRKCGAVLFDDYFWARFDDVRIFIKQLERQGEQVEIGQRFALWRSSNA